VCVCVKYNHTTALILQHQLWPIVVCVCVRYHDTTALYYNIRYVCVCVCDSSARLIGSVCLAVVCLLVTLKGRFRLLSQGLCALISEPELWLTGGMTA